MKLLRRLQKYFYLCLVGGGIRSKTDIDKVWLGADKVAINSAALKDKDFFKAVDKYGNSTIPINIETNKINGKYEVLTELVVKKWC